jgi:phosphoenolpyruvate carboxykinase (GTP)
VPPHLIDWQGQDWTPDSGRPASHPNSRFCTPITQCPVLADEYFDPNGVPISAILFGGRRASTMPLVMQARDWAHGVFLGATLSSETTAAAAGEVGVVRRDPMAMRPFLGYHVGDYFRHWLELGKNAGAGDPDRLPRVFTVNWFRRGADGRYLWPGFGENARVLRWVVDRIEGRTGAVETPAGAVPTPDALDLSGLSVTRGDLEAALAVDRAEWRTEVAQVTEWFTSLGERVPGALWAELQALEARLA